MDLVSVIIPVYHVEPYLDRCVQSVVDQTYHNLEIILVDDGSPDNCPAMCDAWAKKDNRIIVIHKDNGGVSSARNAGIRASSGDFCIFLDSDDVLKKETVQYLVMCQQEFSSDITIAKLELRSNHRTENESIPPYDDLPKRVVSTKDFFRLGMQKRWVTGRLIRKQFACSARFDESVKNGEDTIYQYSLMMNQTPSISMIDYPLYIYYLRSDSASAGKEGLIAFSILGSWCVDHFNSFNSELKPAILLEGLKNCFVYRYEMNSDKNERIEENSGTIYKGIKYLWKSNSNTLRDKICYSAFAIFPSVYRVFVKIKNK